MPQRIMSHTHRVQPYLEAIPSLSGYSLDGRLKLYQAQEIQISILLLVVLLGIQVESLEGIVGRMSTSDDGILSTSNAGLVGM